MAAWACGSRGAGAMLFIGPEGPRRAGPGSGYGGARTTAGFGLASGSVASSWGRGSGSARARGGAGGSLGSAGSDGGPRAAAERGAGPEAEARCGREKEDDPDRWGPPVGGSKRGERRSGPCAEMGREKEKGRGKRKMGVGWDERR